MNNNVSQKYLVKMLIPTTDFNQKIDEIELESRFVQSQILFDSLYGGSTLLDKNPVRGSYVSDSGEVIREELYIIESQTMNLNLEELKKGIQILKELWNQESISIKIVTNEEYLFF